MAASAHGAMLGPLERRYESCPRDITTNDRVGVEGATNDGARRSVAAVRLQAPRGVRKFKLYAAAWLAMLVLTPVWVVTEYMNADGWPERLSEQSPGGTGIPGSAGPGSWGLLVVGFPA